MNAFKNEQGGLTIRIPWDSNTFRGFVIASLIIALSVWLGPYLYLDYPPVKLPENTSIPMEIIKLRFGSGGNDAKSHGNLAEEGKSVKSPAKSPALVDASAPKNDNTKKTAKPADPKDLTANLSLTKRNTDKNENIKKSSSDENTNKNKANLADHSSPELKGEKNGNDEGTGKGLVGKGPGKGQGNDPDFGGNNGFVIATNKPIPRAPAGLNNSTIVKLKFVVNRHGDVESIIPLTRGTPIAEQAAQKALWLWKFKILNNEERVEGIIKFHFDVN